MRNKSSSEPHELKPIRELEDGEEIVGAPLRFSKVDGTFEVEFQELSLELPLSAIPTFKSLGVAPGDLISILRIGPEDNLVRLRLVKRRLPNQQAKERARVPTT